MLPVHDYTAVAMARKAGMNCRPLTVPATAGGLCTVPIFVLGKCVPWGLPWGCRVYTALPRIPNRCPKWSCRGKRKRKFILKTRKDIFFLFVQSWAAAMSPPLLSLLPLLRRGDPLRPRPRPQAEGPRGNRKPFFRTEMVRKVLHFLIVKIHFPLLFLEKENLLTSHKSFSLLHFKKG